MSTARLGREPEDALAHDVALDLVGPAADRDRRGHQEERLPFAVVDDSLGPEQRQRDVGGRLQQRAAPQLGPGALGAGHAAFIGRRRERRLLRRRPSRPLDAGTRSIPRPPHRQPGDLGRDVRGSHAVATDRVDAPLTREIEEALRGTRHPGAHRADRPPLVGERGSGDGPTRTDLRDAVAVRDDHSVEEDLVEVRVSVHLPQGPHIDAGSGHVDRERGDAGVLGDVDVAARQAEAPPRVVRATAPHLLAREAPHVAVALGARREVREVGAGAGLGEQLAPDLLTGADRGEPACALLGGRRGEQRRPDDVEPDEVGIQVRLAEPGELAGDLGDLRRRRAAAAVLDRPRRHRPPLVRERAEPRSAASQIVGARAEHRGRGVVLGRIAEVVVECDSKRFAHRSR